jgi:hypothetical protein
MYVLTTDYFKYSIVTEVNMIKHRDVIAPAFSLCLPYVEAIDWNLMRWNFTSEEWIKMTRDQKESLTQQLQQNWTIAEIFRNTVNLTDLKTAASWIRKPMTYEVDYTNEHLYIKKYLRDDFVCFMMCHADVVREGKKFSFKSHHNSFGDEPGVLMYISLERAKMQRITKLSVFLHASDKFPRGDADFPFIYIATNDSIIFANGSTYVGMTYTQTTLHFLPPPYSTNCFDYTLPIPDFESQEDCIDKCMTVKVLQKFNETSFTATFTYPRDFKIMSKYSVQLSRVKENKVDLIYQSCLDQCPMIECEQTRYLPALVSARDSSDVTFSLYEPNGPETIVRFYAKLTLMELYVQIMSVCGVWLGVTLADVAIRSLYIILRTRPLHKEIRRKNIRRRYPHVSYS